MSSNSKYLNKTRLMVIALILNLAAVIMLFFPIINLHSEDTWGFSINLSIAGYQFIFGSGNSFVDFILNNVSKAKTELIILAVVFMAVPAVLTIVSAVIKYLCREKKSGSIVPIVLEAISFVEIIIFFIVTSYRPAAGMVLFLTMTVLSIVLNIITLIMEKNVVEEKTEKKEQKTAKGSEMQEYTLKGVSGIYAGATIKLGEQPVWVGRDSSQCNIILNGGKVSRRHCCIWVDNSGKVMIRDTSTNGVYFPNGDRMLSNIDTELHAGDTIFIGNSENSFQII